MKEIFKCVFGSRMYGLDTEKSDLDYKSVFIYQCEQNRLALAKPDSAS